MSVVGAECRPGVWLRSPMLLRRAVGGVGFCFVLPARKRLSLDPFRKQRAEGVRFGFDPTTGTEKPFHDRPANNSRPMSMRRIS